MLQPHIQLDESINTKYAILPGDPARVDRIAEFLDNPKIIQFNREYKSIIGTYKGIRILAMSTGMGGVSTAIGIEELANLGIQTVIRIGSCGSSQPEVELGDLVLSIGSVRDDGTSPAYIRASYPAVPDYYLLTACIESAKELNIRFHLGLTRSHESFYAEKEIAQVPYWEKQGIMGEDMETAPLMVVGRMRGLRTASILNNISGKDDIANSIGEYAGGENVTAQGEINEILVALEACYKTESEKGQ